MEATDLKGKLEELAGSVLSGIEIELVDLDLFVSGKRTILRLYVHREGGVTVGDCTKVSREFGVVLDLEDIFPGNYQLEVSSPGVDRPLKTLRDYERNMGRMLRVGLSERIADKKQLDGRLSGADEKSIVLLVEEDSIHVPLEKVLSAKVQIEF